MDKGKVTEKRLSVLRDARAYCPARKPLQCVHGSLLSVVRLQLIRGDQTVVGGPYGSAHREEGPLGRFTFLSVPLKL